MKSCQQAQGLSIYQHGIDVANRYRDLYELLTQDKSQLSWNISDDSLAQLREICKQALSPKDARAYHIFHDCGKPYCRTVDESGRQHFPDHARHSAEIYRQIFHPASWESADERSAQLIELDMACHTLKGEEAEEFAKHELAPTLILTAWGELHANAEKLFGGFETDSFKIKRKQLSKITTKIYKVLS